MPTIYVIVDSETKGEVKQIVDFHEYLGNESTAIRYLIKKEIARINSLQVDEDKKEGSND